MFKAEFDIVNTYSIGSANCQFYKVIQPNDYGKFETHKSRIEDNFKMIEHIILKSNSRFDVILIKHSSNDAGKFETTSEVIIPVEE